MRDIAKRVGLSVSTVNNWPARYDDFPEPVTRVNGGYNPVYLWDEVWAWHEAKRESYLALAQERMAKVRASRRASRG